MATFITLDSPALYTVGWIAALPIERAAAILMLDERHNKPSDFFQHQADTNSYTWGKIGEHNVVIASLPAGFYGTTSAATTASNLLSSFPQIKIGLLVGIGGGIARPEQGRDIRLGDIVVSQPQGTTGGVIQYDLRKEKSNGRFERKDFLSMPPRILLQALATLQAEHELGGSRVAEFLKSMPQKKSRTGRSTRAYTEYVHQGYQNDLLFKSSYDHISGHDCHNCKKTETVNRNERDTTDPEIHYGIIASGNTLVKDSATRDKIVDDVGEECICFEMEAAGLMNHFPCLVIRGICDYADSHKNDRWQRYASATAAAYGKELLSYVPVRDLWETQSALDVLRSMDRDIKNIYGIASHTITGLESLKSDSHLKKIEEWLSAPNSSTNLNEALKKRQEGTGSWFLLSKSFKMWTTGTRRHLWLQGIPGCGKTVLTATIIEHLNQQLDASCVILEFFFDFTDIDKQTLGKLVRSLVAQLYRRCENCRKELDKLLFSCEDGRRQPTYESLLATFLNMLKSVKNTKIVIDALDECQTRRDLLLWLEGLISSQHEGLQLLVTSRMEEDIEFELKRWLDQESIISVQRDLVNIDIRTYVYAQLRSDHRFERWHSKPTVQEEIEIELTRKADGMFRWAACQLDILQKCLDLQMLRKSLSSLPKSLEETYGRILAGIDEHYRHYAIMVLQFLAYSKRPLTIQEAVDVVAVDLDGIPHFDVTFRMPEPREIIRVCSSLVSLVKRRVAPFETEEVTELQLAHFSVQQYLTSERIQTTFPKTASDFGEIFQNNLRETVARGQMTRVCLAYLSHLDHRKAVEEIKAEFPLAEYSARFWMDHARVTETVEDVRERVLNFFLQQSQRYNLWGKLFDPDQPSKSTPYQQREMATPLYYACLADLQQIARLLVKEGASVNAQSGRYGNALQAASSQGHKGIVLLLIEEGADVNAQGGHYGNALQAASSEGHKDIVQLLLGYGANVNAQGGAHGNALQTASFQGYTEIVQLLLENGADYKAQSGNDGNALQAASIRGHKAIVQLLLEIDADINMQSGIGDALQAASFQGHTEIVQLLLKNSPDLNAYNANNGNALQAASIRGHSDIVRLLLESGTDVNAKLSSYGNALQAASERGRKKTVQLLLDNGADVNAQGGDYGNALQLASLRGHREIVQILLENGADANAQGGDCGTALQAASERGSKEIVQLLLDNGADVNAQGGDYGNALQLASLQGHRGIVQLLLENGADVKARGGPYGNPLRAALFRRDKQIIQLLLRKGANVNVQCRNALYDASFRGDTGMVQLLLSIGANVNAKRGRYGNPLQAASYKGHVEIVRLLLRKGANVNAQGGYYESALKAAEAGRRESEDPVRYDPYGSLQTGCYQDIVGLLRDNITPTVFRREDFYI